MRHLVVGCSGVPSSRPVTQVPHSSSTAVRFSRCVICVLQPLPPLDPRIFGARTTSTCDVGVCNERRQTVCTEPFRLGNAAHRRDALRVRNAAFLIAIWAATLPAAGPCPGWPGAALHHERGRLVETQIEGYTGASDSRSAFILFRHPDEPYLVQCRASYDVSRTPSVTLNCYKLQ